MRSLARVALIVVSLMSLGSSAAIAQGPYRELSAEEKAGIEAVLPAKAPAKAAKTRRLLIYDGNVGYGGHGSIPFANHAFTRMGEATGAFTATVSRDPEVFSRARLDQFDAVCLNNTVGNLFTDPVLRRNLIEFVMGGGGLLGIHGTTVAFTDFPQGARETWPEFGRMLGARGAAHLAQDERVTVKLDSPTHPLNRPFGGHAFEHVSEFFRVHDPYSRDRVHVLFSIDTARTELPAPGTRPGVERDDRDYALAWTRNHGRGRVVYCTIGHSPSDFMTPTILEFYLGALQFIMGDMDGTTTPSNRLTPAVAAREKLGWRLAVTAWGLHQFTLFEAIDKTRQFGLSDIEGLSFQKVSADIPKNLDTRLTDDEIEQIRLKLDDAGVRMPTCYYAAIPDDDDGCRQVFEFCRKLGVETLISEPPPESLDRIERFCDAYDIRLAIHNHGPDQSPVYWRPEGVLEVCRGRSKRIGACADTGYWIRSGIDPLEGVRKLGDRLITIQPHDLSERTPQGLDVPWGTGQAGFEPLLLELHRLELRPTVIGLEYSRDFRDNMRQMAQCIEYFDSVVQGKLSVRAAAD
ncbi:MAG: ThuA domain-containing protein [Pirellulaceae bacterium]|nr:ThuA domain-containing protein [Pirellulaceae bacterium]